MKRLSVLWFLVFCPAFIFAQENMTLDNAIKDAVNFFSTRLDKGTLVAVTNFEAETKELSDFVIQELLVAFANTGVKVVGRIDAQIIFSGSISQYRNMYRMRIEAKAVENAEVIGTKTINIKYDATLTGLLGKINPADKWKYQWLYAGANIGYNAGIVDLREDWEVYVPIGASLYVMVQPFDLFGIGIDMSFGSSFAEGLSISVTPTLTIRPSLFEIDVFAGIGFNTSGGIVYLGGVRGGIKLGPGVIYVEARPMANSVTTDWGYAYTNFAINIGLGYQIGFIQRKK